MPQTSAQNLRVGESSASHAGSSAARPRVFFIDNLRWTMIILVVSMHAAVTYSGVGRWYYLEQPLPSLPIRVVFATYQSFLQAFFMGLLFFIAGYFVPGSFDKKGASVFLRDRAIRLGLPSLLYMLVIGPLTEYYVAQSWAPDRKSSFVSEWVAYFASGRIFSGSGPLWFCLALLIFCAAYCCIRVMSDYRVAARLRFPGNRQIVALIGVMAVATFLVRIAQPMGTAVFNMQLCFFSQYILLFCAGILTYRNDWLTGMPSSPGTRWLAASLIGGLILWCIIIPLSGVLKGNAAPLNGGFSWQSAAMSVWESFVCVGVCLGLLTIFRERFNTRSLLTQFLSENAFAVYVIHPPVLIGFSRAFRQLVMPSLLKFLLLTAFSIVGSFLLSALVVRRIPGLKKILS